MRFYKLEIEDIGTFTLDSNNPYAPCIRFDIQQYTADSYSVAYIELFNMDLSFFKNPKPFIDKMITLTAGMKETPLNRLFGYQYNSSSGDLIYRGFISNVTCNWNVGSSTSVTFILSPSTTRKDNLFVLDIKKGDNIITHIKNCIESLYPKANIISDNEILTAKNPIKQTIYNMYDLYLFASNQVIDNSYVKIVTSFNGYRLIVVEKGSLKELGGGIKETILVKDKQSEINAIKLEPYMLLEQPQYINFSECQFSIILNPQIKIGNFIKISDDIVFNNASFLRTVHSYNEDNDNDLTMPKVFFNGVFNVTKVWHIGDSTNPNPQSWTTNFEATKNYKSVV